MANFTTVDVVHHSVAEPVVSEEDIQSELRLLTLNIAHGRGTGAHQVLLSKEQVLSNLNRIVDMLRRERPHIVALQEADGVSRWNGGFHHVHYLAERAGYSFSVSGVHMNRFGLNYGTAILSTVELRDAVSAAFVKSTRPLPAKGFVSCSFESRSAGASFRVVSLHLDFLRRRVRTRQIRHLIEHLSPHAPNLIVMGDFNCDWGSKDSALREIKDTLQLTVHEPEMSGLQTFPARRKRWDWILTPTAHTPIEYGSISDALSDHRAVLTKIKL